MTYYAWKYINISNVVSNRPKTLIQEDFLGPLSLNTFWPSFKFLTYEIVGGVTVLLLWFKIAFLYFN